MSDAFLGEIRIFSFEFVPVGWAACDGTLLPINQNVALNSLLGTTFGGNGTTTFGLPDLRGTVPVYDWALQGQKGGAEMVTLLANNIPTHTHLVSVQTGVGNEKLPTNYYPASGGPGSIGRLLPQIYAAPGTLVSMSPAMVGNAGGNLGHPNMQPYAVVNFCICLSGYYPPRS